MEKKGRSYREGKIDYMVLILTVAITVIGIIMVYSASYVNSGFRYEDPNRIIYLQYWAWRLWQEL